MAAIEHKWVEMTYMELLGDRTRSAGSERLWDPAAGAWFGMTHSPAVPCGASVPWRRCHLFHQTQVFPRWDYLCSRGAFAEFKGVNTGLLAFFQAEQLLLASLISPLCCCIVLSRASSWGWWAPSSSKNGARKGAGRMAGGA